LIPRFSTRAQKSVSMGDVKLKNFLSSSGTVGNLKISFKASSSISYHRFIVNVIHQKP
jgi:hypothetical protein